MTGDEKYARKAVELLGLYGRQYLELTWRNLFDPPWNSGPPILASSRSAGVSTYGSNWFYKGHCRLLSMVADSPQWTDEQRRAVYEGFVVPLATEIMKYRGDVSNQTDISNHDVLLLGLAWRDAGLVRWALYHDAGLLARLADIDADGFSSEGRPLNYHFAEMAEYLPSLAFLENSGLSVAYPKEHLLAAIRMPFERATLSGVIPSSGDCGRGMQAGPNALADYLAGLFPAEEWLLSVGTRSTLQSRLRQLGRPAPTTESPWRSLLETEPRLFREAGLAILRSGTTPETQVMVTLDYGRNLFHGALDRNQITLCAFGKVYSHGPGSLYNAGSGGMTRAADSRLDTFCTHGSLGQNVVLVDGRDQAPAVGKLLQWDPTPQRQVAVSRVDGISPGVSHTRAVVLSEGVVVLLDRLASEAEHTYDFAYHNLGLLQPGAGWTATPVAEPLATTANYANLIDLSRLSGSDPLRLTWDLTRDSPEEALAAAEKAGTGLPPRKLGFWQLPTPGGEWYSGVTGMNNPNSHRVPDTAPSVLQRARGRTVTFVTVLEPYTEQPRVQSVAAQGDSVTVSLSGGGRIEVSLASLLGGG
jgi:hypothetical protein